MHLHLWHSFSSPCPVVLMSHLSPYSYYLFFSSPTPSQRLSLEIRINSSLNADEKSVEDESGIPLTYMCFKKSDLGRITGSVTKTCRYSGIKHSSEIDPFISCFPIYFLIVNIDPCNKGDESEIQCQFFICVVSLIESVLKTKNPDNKIYLHSIITIKEKDFNVRAESALECG